MVSGGTLLDWLAGPILFAFFGSVWLISGGRAMGFGDAKLGLSLGLLLGAPSGLSAIVLAFWIGAASSLGFMFLIKMGFLKRTKKLTMKSEVPFAPFMIIGAWLALVFHLNLLHAASF
jgi:leader peptidase (prepilin peptidase)/N-methyltransferase